MFKIPKGSVAVGKSTTQCPLEINVPFGIFQTFITSGHCAVDLPTAYYPFGIFQTFITSGHCVVDLPTANDPFGILNIYY
jgi:hypothetical protein